MELGSGQRLEKFEECDRKNVDASNRLLVGTSMLKAPQVKGQKEVRSTVEDTHLALLKTKIVIDRL